MEKLLRFIISAIVEKPKEIKIQKEDFSGLIETGQTQKTAEKNFINFRLTVAPDDLKIVIGKKGRTIKAIRNLLRLRALKENKRVNFELQEV